MAHFDYNASEKLIENTKRLGWISFCPLQMFLKNTEELKKVPEFSSVSSESSEVLRTAAKRVMLIDVSRLKNFEKDEGLVRAVAQRGAFFEIPLKPFLMEYGGYRVRHMQRMRDFIRVCLKYNAGLVFSSHAESVYDLKSPFEVSAILQQLSLSREQAEAILTREINR